ncbi:MAG: Tim44/TimA family putative adaptor protein [Alphaproteobacteria bacterium]
MNEGIQFIDILLFAGVAAFLIWRLRGVLGRRTGHERHRPGSLARRVTESEEGGSDRVIPLPDRSDSEGAEALEPAEKDSATPLDAGLARIQLADPDFNPEDFIKGAGGAFGIVVEAFAAGDAGALRPLLSDDVYDNFTTAMKARQSAGQTLETTLVGLNSAELIEAHMRDYTAFVTVKFVSEQINVTRDAEGAVVEGDPNHIATVTDIWTFARNTRSRDPNWTLVETRSSN